MSDSACFSKKLEATMSRRSAITTAVQLALSAALLLGACQDPSPSPRVGSETNFLGRCEAGCGTGLSCVCGVCTHACSVDDDCSALAVGVQCVAESSRPSADTCAATPSAARCDLRCEVDADCAPLDAAFGCRGGYCRVPEEATAPTCRPTLPPGDNARTVTVGGVTRNYVVRVPESEPGSGPLPLVVDFHTLGGNPASEAAASGYRELAEQVGFVVAWPQGIDASWDVGPCCAVSGDVDDLGFARALVAQVAQEACIDVKRVYAVGIAIGGGLAYHLACNAADVFAAIAPSAFDLLEESEQPCTPSRPLTVMSFRGTADTVVPYDGGAVQAPNDPRVTIHLLGATGTFERWAELNDCAGAPSPADGNGCSTYDDCADGVEVTLCTTEGGGIAWGSAELAWATLERHSLP
jgi:polyhydroxybutyrate depolymerase